MDTLFSLRVFREVIRCGSFTRAADKLGISTAMASKHVSHLEKQVCAKLLQRNSRNLHLTEAGEQYHRCCVQALETLDTAAERAAGSAETPQGQLRITMPMWFANTMFCGWLAEYRRRHPQVSLDLILDNRKADLIAEGIDLALRVSSDGLPPGLIVRPLAEIPFYLVAAPEHLAGHGTPATPQQAAAHPFVLPSYTDADSLTVSRGRERHTLRPEAAVRSDNTQMTHKMILAGCGLGYLPEWTARQDLASGRLVRILSDWHILTATLYAAYPNRTFLSAKVRSFIDFLCEKTGAAAQRAKAA